MVPERIVSVILLMGTCSCLIDTEKAERAIEDKIEAYTAYCESRGGHINRFLLVCEDTDPPASPETATDPVHGLPLMQMCAYIPHGIQRTVDIPDDGIQPGLLAEHGATVGKCPLPADPCEEKCFIPYDFTGYAPSSVCLHPKEVRDFSESPYGELQEGACDESLGTAECAWVCRHKKPTEALESMSTCLPDVPLLLNSALERNYTLGTCMPDTDDPHLLIDEAIPEGGIAFPVPENGECPTCTEGYTPLWHVPTVTGDVPAAECILDALVDEHMKYGDTVMDCP